MGNISRSHFWFFDFHDFHQLCENSAAGELMVDSDRCGKDGSSSHKYSLPEACLFSRGILLFYGLVDDPLWEKNWST
uniref:Uncharacterized protein n=1 Tax=Rhizophora mucronata TaxID=61149 RepID=A0A2P2MDU1_RHIMU